MLRRPASRLLAAAGLLWLGSIVFGLGCGSFEVTTLYEGGVVVSVSPAASDVGCRVIEEGGNAFDAAVAVGFALAVTCPQAGNIGGGGFAVVRNASDGAVEALDFRETAPGAATLDMFLDRNGEPDDSLSTTGALSAGVPGSVAGLHALWEKHGSRPWSDLVTPAALLADTGFTVDPFLASEFHRKRDRLKIFEATRAIFAVSGSTPAEGVKLTQPDLARTLYMIAAEGPTGFYEGAVADSLVACMEMHGGLINHDDLKAYQPIWREPVHFSFDSLEVYSMPPPSSGGLILGQIMKLIEPFDFSRYTSGSPEYIHLFTETARLAYADRSEHLGDPAFWEVPEGLLDSAYLAIRRELVSVDHAGSSGEVHPGHPARYESESTTHYSICDRDGNMVSITTTLNSYFGSGLVVSGAGFILNNEMDDFSVKPGHPNQFGLVGAEANKIEPGKRMLSSMTPTLILHQGDPFLIIGSPGGSRIITAVAQGIINYTRFNLPLDEAISLPRFHHQWLPDKIYLEEGSYDVATIQRLIRFGHEIKEVPPMGALEAVAIQPTGLMVGAADPRRGAAVAGCNAPMIN